MTFFSAPPREQATRPHQSWERLLTFQVPGLSRLIWKARQWFTARKAERIDDARRIALEAYDQAVRRKDTRKQAERWPAAFQATNEALRGGR